MKIKIDVSEKNEGTEAPWWAIVDPRQNLKTDKAGVANIASMITGPFFSRESAENHLSARRYNFGKNAAVWCFSGYWSHEYKMAIRDGRDKMKIDETLGERLRRKRKEKNLGLRETARKVDISPTFLSRIENGNESAVPSEKVIRALAHLLDDDFDTIMQLAGRVPADIVQIIKSNPKIPAFLRRIKMTKKFDLDDDETKDLLVTFRKQLSEIPDGLNTSY